MKSRKSPPSRSACPPRSFPGELGHNRRATGIEAPALALLRASVLQASAPSRSQRPLEPEQLTATMSYQNGPSGPYSAMESCGATPCPLAAFERDEARLVRATGRDIDVGTGGLHRCLDVTGNDRRGSRGNRSQLREVQRGGASGGGNANLEPFRAWSGRLGLDIIFARLAAATGPARTTRTGQRDGRRGRHRRSRPGDHPDGLRRCVGGSRAGAARSRSRESSVVASAMTPNMNPSERGGRRRPLTYHVSRMSLLISPGLSRLAVLRVWGFGLLLALGVASSGCAGSDDATKPITYSLTAKQNYEKGIAELKDENYPEAQKYFQFVRSKFPFSKYAVLAELAIADTQFERGNYTEATDSYKTVHAPAPDAREGRRTGTPPSRLASAAYKDMPDDVWLLPPSYEKDQSAVGDALRELDEFMKKYPDSPYVKDAQPLRREALKRLVDHEVYVARFYLDRDYPKAAAMRIEGAIRRYPGSGREAELLLALGQTYLHMGEAARARDTFERVVNEYRNAEQARRSELYLEYIKAIRRAPRRSVGEGAARDRQWMSGPDGNLTRGREHYAAGEYGKAEAFLAEIVAETKYEFADVFDMLGVIYHQQGRLRRRRSDVQAGAEDQPGLHRGGAEPGGHLQRSRQVRRSERGLRAGAADVQERAEAAGSLRQGARSPTCTPTWAAPTTTSVSTSTPSANTRRRWRCARRFTTSARAWARPCARWAAWWPPRASSSAFATTAPSTRPPG